MKVTLDIIGRALFWLLFSYVISFHFSWILNIFLWRNYSWGGWFFLISFVTIAGTFIRPLLVIKTDDKAVLITGCDTGFGYLLARKLHELGFTVFAGCLQKDGEGAKVLSAIDPQRLHVIQLDITSEEQIQDAVTYVKKHLPHPENGLWGLVNNGGVSAFGFIEWTSLENLREVTEVNLWGTIRVTNAFLPLVRQAQGRVVNMSSMLGCFTAPARGAYSITKYGIEALSDALRYELRPFGVNVSVLEPDNFTAATNILNEEKIIKQHDDMWNNMSDEVKYAYGYIFTNTTRNIKAYTNKAETELDMVIDAYVDALMESFPLPRYQPMTLWTKTKTFIAHHFPEFIFEILYIPRVRK